MNRVRLYYIKHEGEDDLAKIDSDLVTQWLAALSSQKKSAVMRLVRNQNRLTSLLGLQLLNLCAQDDGIAGFEVSDVQYPEVGKPFVNYKNAFYDFNISHSGNMIVVATSKTAAVGIDVEKIRELKRLSFKMVLSADELLDIERTADLFFELWSKKEAVVKAANTTGIARMRSVSLKQERAVLDDKTWHLHGVGLDKGYASYLATSEPVDELIVKQIQLTDLQ